MIPPAIFKHIKGMIINGHVPTDASAFAAIPNAPRRVWLMLVLLWRQRSTYLQDDLTLRRNRRQTLEGLMPGIAENMWQHILRKWSAEGVFGGTRLTLSPELCSQLNELVAAWPAEPSAN